jgi:hypothetical protein
MGQSAKLGFELHPRLEAKPSLCNGCPFANCG